MRPAVYKHWNGRTRCDRYRVGRAELEPTECSCLTWRGCRVRQAQYGARKQQNSGTELTIQTYQAVGCRRPYAVLCALPQRLRHATLTASARDLTLLPHTAPRRHRRPIDNAHRIGVTTTQVPYYLTNSQIAFILHPRLFNINRIVLKQFQGNVCSKR